MSSSDAHHPGRAPEGPHKVQLLLSRPSVLVGAVENVLLAAWTDRPPHEEDVHAGVSALFQRAKHAGRCASLVMIGETTPLPDDHVRQAVQTDMRKLEPHLCCGATVIDRSGLAGAAMRAVVSTLQLLSRTKHPEKIFASVREAAAFVHDELTRHGERAPSVGAIVAACEELQAQAKAR